MSLKRKSLHRREYFTEDNNYSDEAQLGWRNIIFLPFGNVWQIIFNMSIFLNSFIVIYILAYGVHETEEMKMEGLHYILEFMFFIETILFILHRRMKTYRIIRDHEPRDTATLTVDVFTLLPLYEVYLLLTYLSRHGSDLYIRRYIRTKSVIRLYRVCMYFHKMKARAASNQIWFIVLEQFFFDTMCVHILAAIWYSFSCWQCDKPNWTHTISDKHVFDSNSPFEWFLLSYGTIANLFFHNYKAEIHGITASEKVLFLATMILGHLMHYMLFIGSLVISNFNQQRRHFHYVRRIKNIKTVLEVWRIDSVLKRLTLNYYDNLWERYSGIKYMPSAYRRLPTPLKKEVMLDLFWDALNHSYLFQNEDVPFKRALSLEMKSEFYQPGDYVIGVNYYKTKMIYISSGILEVLSEEDEEVAIMSFSSGTILGEISLIRPMNSTATVRCASVCELHTLSLPAFYRVLLMFPEKLPKFRSVINNRIKDAETLLEDVQTAHKEKGDTIIWLKKKWKELNYIQTKKLGRQKVVEKLGSLIHAEDRYHTVNNLGLLVLSEDIELKMKAICLNKHCPFVLEPNSSFQTFFYHLLLMVVFLQLIWIPYVFSFEHTLSDTSFSVLFLLDGFYFLDIYLQLSTAIKHRNHTSASTLQIAVEKIRSVWFLIDVLATVPIDYIVYIVDPELRWVVFFKLNRLLKAYKLVMYMSRKENKIIMNIVTVKFLKYILIYAITCYLATCLWYSVACFETKCYEKGWYMYNKKTLTEEGIDLTNAFDPVIQTIYYALSVILCGRHSSIIEYLMHEKIIRHIMICFAHCAFSLFFSEICAAMVLSLQETQRYREYIASMKVFLKRGKFNQYLRKQVAAVIEFKWAYNKNVVVSGPSGILFDAPEYLKTKVILGRIEDCLKKSYLFSQCADNVLKDVALVTTLRAVPPDVTLSSHDFKSNSIYVILRGYCALHSRMPGDKERASRTILTFGDCFPVIETLHQVLLLVDVKSLTSVQLICIDRGDLFRVLKRHPLVHDELAETVKQHFKKNKSKLLRLSGRLPPMIPAQQSLGHGDMFTYTLSDKVEVNTQKEAFLIPFENMGKLSHLKHFLCIGSVNPKRPLFLCIETFHYLCGFSRTFTAMFYDNIFFPHKDKVNFFFRGTDILYAIFLYIRMHVQYYNESGILVTHTWMTMKHYLSTTFAIDLWSFVPISYSGFYDFIGRDNRIFTGFVFRISSRPVQMHRFIGLLNYFQSNIQSPRVYAIQAVKYITVVSITIGLIGMIFQYHSIKVSDKGIFYANNSWAALSHYKEDFTLFMVFLACINMSFTYFTTVFTSTYVMVRNEELLLAIFVCSFYFLLRVFFLSKLASAQIGGSSSLTVYQENVKSFENFMKHELVEEDLVEATIEDHRFLWKNKDVGNVVDILNEFHDHLHVELIYQLHGDTLRACDAFAGVDESFYRQLGVKLEEQYFSKDSEIIRCNDIQDLVYIVKKGRVDVMLAKSKLCSMGSGGMFGCFRKHGKMRQTINVVAKVHVVVLTVPNQEFSRLIAGYPHVEMAIANANIVNAEYLESQRYNETEIDQNSESICSTTSKFRFRQYLLLFSLVNDSSKLYKFWNYISSVHIASISAIAYSVLTVMLRWDYAMKITFRIISAILDLYFLIRIYVGAHLIYKDPHSGILVTDVKLIRRRYFLSLLRFWLDFITVLPFEYIALFITDDINYTKYGYAPRVLRCWFLYSYYKEQEENLNVRQHLRLTYLLYRVILSSAWTGCIWWICYCAEGRCEYSADGRFRAYLNVLNIFTMNGLMRSFNDTKIQMILFFLLACMSFITLLALISGYATKVQISTYSQANYEYDIEKLRIYLKDRDLSPFILNKVWTYCLQLWHLQRGEWMPSLITGARKDLKQDLMSALYGHHIHMHYLFTKTHTDFTRQLLVHLKRCVYFPGNFIVEKGDIDGCMYFIHKGQVTVIDVQDKTEVTRELLVQGKSFGEAQGLFMIPHQFSYRAHTIVDTISLKFKDWQYLLHWFPASKECIYKSAAEFGVRAPTRKLK